MAKSNKSAPAFLSEAEPPPQNADKLDALRDAVTRAHDKEREIDDLEARLKELKADLQALYFTELPDMMDAAQTSVIGVEARGNQPGFTASLKPYYSANIAAAWPEDRKATAFRWLDDNAFGDLIKTSVEVRFQREQRAKAIALVKKIEAEGLAPEVKQSVHSGTLTAWLREQVEGGSIPPLEIIGGAIGRVVKIKSN